MKQQLEMFEPGVAKQFATWKATPGGRRVLQMAYAIAAGYARRYARSGRRVSMRLIWESLRDNVGHIRARLKAQGADLENWRGFRLNNNFHALTARHILDRRPEWAGLFELRER